MIIFQQFLMISFFYGFLSLFTSTNLSPFFYLETTQFYIEIHCSLNSYINLDLKHHLCFRSSSFHHFTFCKQPLVFSGISAIAPSPVCNAGTSHTFPVKCFFTVSYPRHSLEAVNYRKNPVSNVILLRFL